MAETRRPAGVMLVMILTWIVAILSAIGGLFFLFAKDAVLQQAGVDDKAAMYYGIYEIIFGALTALVAIGLGKGSRLARLAVTLLMALRIVAATWAAIVLSGHNGFWTAVAAGVIAVFILAMLWNGKADQYFRGK